MLSFNLKSASNTLYVSHSNALSLSFPFSLSDLFWLFCYHAEVRRGVIWAKRQTENAKKLT